MALCRVTALESYCGMVPSIKTTRAIDPYVSSPQYDAPVDDNQNKSALPKMFGLMTLARFRCYAIEFFDFFGKRPSD